jgi:hypothetical protein
MFSVILVGCNDLSLNPKKGFSVIYDANGADSGEIPYDSQKYSAGENFIVQSPSINLEKTDFIMNNWNSKADGTGIQYQIYDAVPISSDLTLYANWLPAGEGSPTEPVNLNVNSEQLVGLKIKGNEGDTGYYLFTTGSSGDYFFVTDLPQGEVNISISELDGSLSNNYYYIRSGRVLKNLDQSTQYLMAIENSGSIKDLLLSMAIYDSSWVQTNSYNDGTISSPMQLEIGKTSNLQTGDEYFDLYSWYSFTTKDEEDYLFSFSGLEAQGIYAVFYEPIGDIPEISFYEPFVDGYLISVEQCPRHFFMINGKPKLNALIPNKTYYFFTHHQGQNARPPRIQDNYTLTISPTSPPSIANLEIDTPLNIAVLDYYSPQWIEAIVQSGKDYIFEVDDRTTSDHTAAAAVWIYIGQRVYSEFGPKISYENSSQTITVPEGATKLFFEAGLNGNNPGTMSLTLSMVKD